MDKQFSYDYHLAERHTNGDSVVSSDVQSANSGQNGQESKRIVWSHKLDFLFSCMGAGIGFGNVWRFPYLCYKNGGGAFLIPYFICVIIGGIPMFFLEISLGQYTSSAGMQAWAICPLMRGIGATSAIIQALINIYYTVILAWVFLYFFSSFAFQLPWSSCNNYWNTARCMDSINNLNNTSSDELYPMDNNTLIPDTYNYLFTLNSTDHDKMGSAYLQSYQNKTDPATEFWENRVLGISNGIEDAGTPRWDLSLCLLFSWILICLGTIKGVKVIGKLMYVTVIVPYVLLTVLLIRGLMLPGAKDGIKYYLLPDWSRLGDSLVWSDAGSQVFFSYALCMGTLAALGSYNKFNHNCLRDAIVFACSNSFTSLFAGLAIFSVLGFMSHEQGVSVADVAESGPGLAFVVYPKAVAQFPAAPIWSVLFFLMLIMLGLSCIFAAVQGVLAAIVDQFPHILEVGYRSQILLIVISCLSFLIGLTMVTDGGIYVFQLMDYFAGSRMILLVGFCECITISYLYGINKYYSNIKEMLGSGLNPFMKINWMILTPIFTMATFVLGIYNYTEVTYNKNYKYPGWSVGIGWIIATSPLLMIPAVAVFGILKTSGNISQRFHILLNKKDINQSKDQKDEGLTIV